MHELYIKSLSLENYRNFSHYQIDTAFNPVIIIGPNGSGKTNILEAISLIFPGKGLRNSKFEEICKYSQNYWKAQYIVHSKVGYGQIERSFTLNDNRRVITFNGSKITGNELSKLTNIIWLTPQMDGLFLDMPKVRRKFFDRIVYSFDDEHAGRITKYEYYLQERAKVLHHYEHESQWLETIEVKLAELALQIASSRAKILDSLKQVIYEFDTPFPKADLFITGEIETIVFEKNEDCLELIKAKFSSNRSKDKISGKTNFGVHRSDFSVVNLEKNIAAKYSSTGEQKALLISIILAQINLLIMQYSLKPILLLDEVFVHLDKTHKSYLIQFFRKLQAQIWVTATDINDLEELTDFSTLVRL